MLYHGPAAAARDVAVGPGRDRRKRAPTRLPGGAAGARFSNPKVVRSPDVAPACPASAPPTVRSGSGPCASRVPPLGGRARHPASGAKHNRHQWRVRCFVLLLLRKRASLSTMLEWGAVLAPRGVVPGPSSRRTLGGSERPHTTRRCQGPRSLSRPRQCPHTATSPEWPRTARRCQGPASLSSPLDSAPCCEGFRKAFHSSCRT